MHLVSVQAANNETGVLQPIADLAQLARENGAVFHSDAAQALGKIPFKVRDLGVDTASFSSHKLYGPKGVGALYVGPVVRTILRPLLFGGGQESGLRPGTLNVPGIVGFGEACCIAEGELREEMSRIGGLRDQLEGALLAAIPGAAVNGAGAERLPGTLSITIPGIPADALMANVPLVCFSNGSACTSGAVSPSHVLLAMGMPHEDAECTVRLSVGRMNRNDEISTAVLELSHAAKTLRRALA